MRKYDLILSVWRCDEALKHGIASRVSHETFMALIQARSDASDKAIDAYDFGARIAGAGSREDWETFRANERRKADNFRLSVFRSTEA
jgi:hypothetical protein